MNQVTLPESPYKGLMPYSESDGPFFFGREQEQQLILANLMASRLTLLYGASGAGKSSVLRAGVAYRLRQLVEQEILENGDQPPEFITTVFNSWRDAPLRDLQEGILNSIQSIRKLNRKLKRVPPPTGKDTLADTLHKWVEVLKGGLLVILDQFEEYFLYHPNEDREGTFAVEFPQAVNMPGLRVNFLISMREDSLAKLDRFKGRINNLFNNYLRIEQLNFEAARAAITNPLQEYNRLLPTNKYKVSIQPELVEEILKQVRVGQVLLGETGRGVIQREEKEPQVEAPYLQLVLNRLWKEEQGAGSPVLRLKTLENLKGSERIVRAHLDECMNNLGPEGRATAAMIFDRLVTPSGSKIAHTVRDLAAYMHVQEDVLAHILDELASGDVRILRRVAPSPERPDEPRYEIFHDVLSSAILNWRTEFLQEHKQVVEERQHAQRVEIRVRAERARQAFLDARESDSSQQGIGITKAQRVRLRIEVVLGDITNVPAPVVVVGHYKDVPPMHVLDEAFEFWISRARARGMIRAELGEVFFVPMAGGQVGAKAVLLAGMGEAGRFSRNDLRYLMTNVAYAVATLGMDRFASVLIGTGAGNLPVESALKAMLNGIVDALKRLEAGERLQQVMLVEYDKARHDEIFTLMNRFAADGSFPDLALEVTSRKLPVSRRRRRPRRERPADLPDEPRSGSRMTIERDGDVFRFSALSEAAVIPVREVEVQSAFASGVAERLMRSSTRSEQEKYGRLLITYLVPEEFHRVIDEEKPLTLILDRSTAAYPWEMASFRGVRGTIFFGPQLRLTRQFRTMLSTPPGVAPAVNRTLKVLVIADPAREPELQLPGARQEGDEVVQVLDRFKQLHYPKLDIVKFIGALECDPVEILALILNEEFDVIHFAGHGIFDEKSPTRSGWVFGKDAIISAREMFRARRVPRLVFANACLSAVVSSGEALTGVEMSRQLAGLAEAFFECGIVNYIGTGWPVEDRPAVTFAKVFYENVLQGESFGDALSIARQRIVDQGPTWGAYQHYGQVGTRLVRPDKKAGKNAGRQGKR